MSTALRAFLLVLVAILTLAVNVVAQPTIVNFDFGAVPIVCAGTGCAYQGPVFRCQFPYPMQDFNSDPRFGWTLSFAKGVVTGNAGLTGPNSAFDPPSFNVLPFTQAVLLQNTGGSILQAVPGFTAGTYTLSFYLGSRAFWGDQVVEALIDGMVIGTWALTSGTPFTLVTAPFTVTTDGTHTVEFRGAKFPPDQTAFLSYVVITPTER